MQDTACLGLVHGDDPERCYREGGGRGVHIWECMYTHGGLMSMYGKTNTILYSKREKKKKKNFFQTKNNKITGLSTWYEIHYLGLRHF